jgi:serine/threonine protein kinase
MAESDEPQIYKQRYKVDKKLGAKKFTTTYLVSDAKAKNELYENMNNLICFEFEFYSSRKVLKVVRLGGMNSEQTLESVREAELLSKLDDKHIVKVKYKQPNFLILLFV